MRRRQVVDGAIWHEDGWTLDVLILDEELIPAPSSCRS